MAGIYLHIPFCKQACVYCNFHFSTRLQNKAALVKALIREAQLRQDFTEGEVIDSIYFGGGTPSLLSASEIETLVEHLQQLFPVSAAAEITLEANPDDLKPSYLQDLAQTPVNRLSIGIQSFRESDLQFMNRAHNAKEALQCVDLAQQAGFSNLTVDLIYGLPDYAVKEWQSALERIQELGVPHFSAYALTVEPKTALNHQIEKGKMQPLNEDLAAQHFETLQTFATEAGYRHYELSNLARPGFEAVHNSSYWQGKTYLGLGPAAHSFRPGERLWNVANNTLYRQALNDGKLPLESENLSLRDQYNERVMTALRLEEGVSLSEIESTFGARYRSYAKEQALPLLQKGQLVQKDESLQIPAAWRFHSDGLAAELFWV